MGRRRQRATLQVCMGKEGAADRWLGSLHRAEEYHLGLNLLLGALRAVLDSPRLCTNPSVLS